MMHVHLLYQPFAMSLFAYPLEVLRHLKKAAKELVPAEGASRQVDCLQLRLQATTSQLVPGCGATPFAYQYTTCRVLDGVVARSTQQLP